MKLKLKKLTLKNELNKLFKNGNYNLNYSSCSNCYKLELNIYNYCSYCFEDICENCFEDIYENCIKNLKNIIIYLDEDNNKTCYHKECIKLDKQFQCSNILCYNWSKELNYNKIDICIKCNIIYCLKCGLYKIKNEFICYNCLEIEEGFDF
jgi:hypothetical protein